MRKLDYAFKKNGKGYYNFECSECGSIVAKRSDVGENAKNCGCNKNKKKEYIDVYKKIINEIKNGVNYSQAVKKLNIPSWKATRAFESNGGKITSIQDIDIEIKNGILFDARHGIKVNKWISSGGYYSFSLNGERLLVHRFIADRCVPKINGKNQVNHKNGIKTDNRIENLEWVTPNENINHAFDTGLNYFGEKSYHSKLKDEEVINIAKSKLSNSKLAKKYKISPQRVCDIKKGRFSKRLKDKFNER